MRPEAIFRFLEELREAGAYIQINADTISGDSGFGAEMYSRKKLMKQGLLDFVGSDGHRQNERIPEIGKMCWKKWKKPWGRNTQKKYLSKIPVRSQGDREKVFIAKEKNL